MHNFSALIPTFHDWLLTQSYHKVEVIFLRIKVKIKAKEHHALMACWGCGGIAPCIIDLSTRWRSVVSCKLHCFIPCT